MYHLGTHRACPPDRTLRRIEPFLAPAGITRLADVTGLDWVGMPVYQAIRPNSRNISVSQGKGLTRTQAKVSALMEALESFHAEDPPGAAVHAPIADLDLGYDPYELAIAMAPSPGTVCRDPSYDPFGPPIGRPTLLTDDTPLDWLAAVNLLTGAGARVPRPLCHLDFCTEERPRLPLFRATSNGLASGNTDAEAVVHGLCEVVERDSVWRAQGGRFDPDRCLAPATVTSRRAAALLDRFGSRGLRTRMVDVTGPVGLPCFEVFLAHPDLPFSYHGAGCHLDRDTALLRALTEAAQSRLGHIAGSRDDLFRQTYTTPADVMAPFALEARRDYSSVPSLSMDSWTGAIAEIAGRIAAVTGAAPLAVDLTRQDFGLPVVFVVAPGLRLIAPRRR